jgi:PTH1 family peptidyl-tRNA hydrolase
MKIFEQLKSHSDKSNAGKVTSGKVTHIIAGLGNPGMQYMNTRHNVGFIAADKIVSGADGHFDKLRFKSNTADIHLGDHSDHGEHRVLVLKPVTFMNLSGEALVEAMHYYKIAPPQTLLICDDIYLEPGKIRIRRKGSHGGHNGLKSIFELTGEEDFPRIKIGVGNNPDSRDLADWVLSKFTDDEKTLMENAYTDTINAAKLIIDGDIDKAMNKYSK